MSGGGGGAGDDQTSSLLAEEQAENRRKKLKASAEVIQGLRTGLSNSLFGAGGSTPIQGTPAAGTKKTTSLFTQ